MDHKLIDEIGGLNDALSKAAQFIGAEDYNIVTIPQPKSVLEEFLEDFQNTNEARLDVENALPTQLVAPHRMQSLIHQMLASDPRISMMCQ